MRLPLIAMTLWLACGCKTRPLHPADARPAPVDLARAAPPADLATTCDETTRTSTVALGSDALPFVAIGDSDQGGEGNCGPPGEAVTLIFAKGPVSSAPARLSILVTRPIEIGTRAVTVFNDATFKSFEATLTITAIEPRPTGDLPELLEGDLSSSDVDLEGHFRAAHCSLFDLFCI